jgi:hypothetical protein
MKLTNGSKVAAKYSTYSVQRIVALITVCVYTGMRVNTGGHAYVASFLHGLMFMP